MSAPLSPTPKWQLGIYIWLMFYVKPKGENCLKYARGLSEDSALCEGPVWQQQNQKLEILHDPWKQWLSNGHSIPFHICTHLPLPLVCKCINASAWSRIISLSLHFVLLIIKSCVALKHKNNTIQNTYCMLCYKHCASLIIAVYLQERKLVLSVLCQDFYCNPGVCHGIKLGSLGHWEYIIFSSFSTARALEQNCPSCCFI